ncbi:MAG: hypothetical protein HQM13_08410 [SAR324 cluster bacterium]|nr:hypothetical protein [SAR324 cluster bacterium]
MSHQCPIDEVPSKLSWMLPPASKVELNHQEIEAAMQEFLQRGGKIKVLAPQSYVGNNEIPCSSAYEPLDFLNWTEENDAVL